MFDEINKILFDSEVGKWALALSEGRKQEADKILEKIFEINPVPYTYLMEQEKEVSNRIKKEFRTLRERKEYLEFLDKKYPDLMDIMVAHGFSILDMK